MLQRTWSPCAARRQWKTYKLVKGPKFALERKKQATELTYDMMAKWVQGEAQERRGC